MSKNLKSVVQHHDKQVGESRNALTKLYRTILMELGIEHAVIDQYLIKYLDDPESGIKVTGKDRASVRGNILKQLGKDAITWKIFCKGLRLLRPKHITLSVELEWSRGRKTVHSVDITGVEPVARADEIDEDEDED